MSEPFDYCDDLGPEKVVYLNDPQETGLKAILVIDNVAAGPSIGGTRMAPDVDLEECLRLARAMTLKNAAAGLPHGGGKSVIVGDPRMPIEAKEKVIRAFAHGISNLAEYIPGPDMGTDEICMAWIRDAIGRAVGLPREVGGIPLDEIGATGFGLCVALEAAEEFSTFKLDGAKVVVQGFGSVGRHAARFLAQKGAVLIAASDTGGSTINPDGLDLDSLLACKAGGRSVAAFPGGKKFDQDAIIDVDCDIWIPAARPDVIDAGDAGRLKARVVAEGANIPCTAEAEKILFDRGVLILPDFIANAGGVICASVEYHEGSERQAFDMIADKIGHNMRQVLEESSAKNIQTRDAAVAMARSRVKSAMSYHRMY